MVEWLSDTLCTVPVSLSRKCNSIDVNYFTRTVTDDRGNKIHLTAKEFDLLFFLYRHKGQVFTKEQIYEKVWGYEIEPHPDNPRYIITVWGVGYKFSGEEKP